MLRSRLLRAALLIGLHMADVFTPEKRSDVMSRIRSTGSKPEERLFQAVRVALGHRWRIDRNVRTLPGCPDIVIPSLKTVIFLDGCFYHCCPVHGHIPKSNVEYWAPKLAKNVQRDRANRARLRQLGFSVWRFWEHDFKGREYEASVRRLDRQLRRKLADR